MKVGFLSPYRDSTGYARAGLEAILALDAAGFEVVPRAIKLNNRCEPIPERVRELERAGTGKVDIIFQHCLPSYFQRMGSAYHIGYFAWETSHFRGTNWTTRLNLMDEVWVINRQMVEACRASGVTRPIKVWPHATDITRFDRWYPPPEGVTRLKQEGRFLFYTVGELTRRKNLGCILRAYMTQFRQSDPVALVVRGDKPGGSPEDSQKQFQGLVEAIAHGLRLSGRPPVIYFIANRMSEIELDGLHQACDCFVSASFGEAWQIPAFDSMCFGKTPIVPGSTGFLDWGHEGVQYLPVKEEPVFGVEDAPPGLYRGDEKWWSVSPVDLAVSMAMITSFSDRVRRDWANQGRAKASWYSREEVGELARSHLSG